jgi:hypothetical protein
MNSSDNRNKSQGNQPDQNSRKRNSKEVSKHTEKLKNGHRQNLAFKTYCSIAYKSKRSHGTSKSSSSHAT